jgi:hypothetical protein
MRVFIERVRGDVKGWYLATKGGLSGKAIGQIDPHVERLPTSLATALQHLGSDIFLPDRPGLDAGCFTGNAAGPGNGAHTYATPDDPTEDRAFNGPFLDRLALNCVPYPLMAAFCAWDGGRLQTYEENSAAYGAGAHPWGSTPCAGGRDANGGAIGPAAIGTTAATCGGLYDLALLNWSRTYQSPAGGVAAKPWDRAFFVSAPGRLPRDVGAGGHMDLGGVMMELTASPGTLTRPPDYVNGVDVKYGATVRWSRARSFDGSPVNDATRQYPIMTKSGNLGGRCARD